MRALQIILALALATSAAAGPVRDQSQAMRAVPGYQAARLQGHWYEVARSPSLLEQDCQGVTADVAPREDSRMTLKITCHKGRLDGPVLNIDGILAETDLGIYEMRFVHLTDLGGLVLVVLWQAEDDSLAVLGTPGGQVGWVWSKSPQVDAATLVKGREALVAAGYRAGAIRPVKQGAAQ